MPPERAQGHSPTDIFSPSREVGNPLSTTHPLPSILTPSTPLLSYNPPVPHIFTSDEIRAKKSQLTRQAYIHGLVEHPPGAIVEYPESGSAENLGIGHVFHVDIKADHFTNPRGNSQYSLGEPQGYHHNVTCLQLRDSETNEPVLCLQKKSSCKSYCFYVIFF